MRTELLPEERAELAAGALIAYRALRGYSDTPETDLIDLLTDLRHHADREGLDFEAAARISYYHHEAEVQP